MSRVTDIILITAIEDGAECEGEHPNADRLSAFIRENHYKVGVPLLQVHEIAGGNKYMQCSVFAGAINHLNADAVVECFANIDWEYPECAQLLLKGEQENTFTSHTITED